MQPLFYVRSFSVCCLNCFGFMHEGRYMCNVMYLLTCIRQTRGGRTTRMGPRALEMACAIYGNPWWVRWRFCYLWDARDGFPPRLNHFLFLTIVVLCQTSIYCWTWDQKWLPRKSLDWKWTLTCDYMSQAGIAISMAIALQESEDHFRECLDPVVAHLAVRPWRK